MMKEAMAALFFVGNMQNGADKFRERIITAYEKSEDGDSSLFWERFYNYIFLRKMTSEDLSEAIVHIAQTLFKEQDAKKRREMEDYY
ncbi:hypothetical protein [Priestia aryabhattai]